MAILFRISGSFALLTVMKLREARPVSDWHCAETVASRVSGSDLEFSGIRSVRKQCPDTRSEHRQKEVISLQRQPTELWAILAFIHSAISSSPPFVVHKAVKMSTWDRKFQENGNELQ
jgi:hypothetical protein